MFKRPYLYVIMAILVSNYMKIVNSNKRGSVLVFSLLVLAVLLSASLSAALVVIADKSSSRTTEKSVVSFQIADGAVENTLKRIYKNSDQNLDTLASNLYGFSGNPSTCSAGIISGIAPACPLSYVGASNCGTFQVKFLDNNGNALQCSGSGFGTYAEWRAKVVYLEAKGTYAGTTRAIKVGVKSLP